jgi:hypothetical protein
MKIPLVGLMSAICAALGLGGLYWYGNLTEEEQAKADQIAANYAKQLYGIAVEELTERQASHVARLTKQHFGS